MRVIRKVQKPILVNPSMKLATVIPDIKTLQKMVTTTNRRFSMLIVSELPERVLHKFLLKLIILVNTNCARATGVI